MIKWIANLTTPEMWFYGLVSMVVSSVLGQWVNQRLSHSMAIQRENRKARITAAVNFRNAFNIEKYGTLRGHTLNNVLSGVVGGDGTPYEGDYAKHKRAVHDYRIHLGRVNTIRLNMAWKKYHGGNEDCPNFFKLYCIKEKGPEILNERIKELRKFGEIK
jgi:hypothetical protein